MSAADRRLSPRGGLAPLAYRLFCSLRSQEDVQGMGSNAFAHTASHAEREKVPRLWKNVASNCQNVLPEVWRVPEGAQTLMAGPYWLGWGAFGGVWR